MEKLFDIIKVTKEVKKMKIISWNCCGKFREKFSFIQTLDADVYVIQECENPEKYKKQFEGFFSNYCWFGEKDSKGLAIFAKNDIVMERNDWPVYCLRHFVSVKLNGLIDLIGVWASPPYIEEYYIYQSINIDKYGDRTLIIGDFNSNVKWDKDHGKRNHSTVVKELKEKNIVSAYHYVTGEKEGAETKSTFYLYRHDDKKYHIDYCFLNPTYIKKFEILESEKWLEHSDHMPIQIII